MDIDLDLDILDDDDLLIVMAVLHTCYLGLIFIQQQTQSRRRFWLRNVNVDRHITGYYNTVFKRIKETDSDEFFKITRMNKPVYDLLFNLLKNKLTRRTTKYTISPEARLALTLSYLSQGVTHQFLAWSFKIGKSTARKIIMDTCEIIWEELALLYVSKPNVENYKNIAEDFKNFWDLPNCVGAIDGKHIAIQCPNKSGSLFYNYKSHFSIVLLAVCDARYIFTMVDVGAYGSQSDGGILQHSEFGKQLLNGKLPLPPDSNLPKTNIKFPNFFVGDPAFPLKTNVMRAYPGKCLSLDKKIFNYRLTRARVVIENAFGILVARWRVLRSPLNCRPENATKIVLATIALHNFVKLNQQSAHTYCPRSFVDHEDSDGNFVPGQWREEVSNNSALQNSNSRKLGSNNSTKNAFKLREELTQYFLKEGAVDIQNKIK